MLMLKQITWTQGHEASPSTSLSGRHAEERLFERPAQHNLRRCADAATQPQGMPWRVRLKRTGSSTPAATCQRALAASKQGFCHTYRPSTQGLSRECSKATCN